MMLFRSLFKTAALCAASAAAAYLLDPQLGRQRRAQVRDRVAATRHAAGSRAHTQGQHLLHRGRGLLATIVAPLRRAGGDDRQLRDRIRTQLGHLVAEPREVEVVVNDGDVSLRGRIRSDEAEPLLAHVLATPGVRHVHNRLRMEDESGATISTPQLNLSPAGTPRGRLRRALPLLAAVAAPLALGLRARRRHAGVHPMG